MKGPGLDSHQFSARKRPPQDLPAAAFFGSLIGCARGLRTLAHDLDACNVVRKHIENFLRMSALRVMAERGSSSAKSPKYLALAVIRLSFFTASIKWPPGVLYNRHSACIGTKMVTALLRTREKEYDDRIDEMSIKKYANL